MASPMSFELKFKLDRPGRWKQKLVDEMAKSMERVAEYTKGEAIRRASVHEGELMRGIDYINLSHKGFDLVSTAPYSAYIEFGTRAHMIRPVNKKALHWKGGKGGGGKDFFSKGHMVSVIVARPFLYPAFMDNKDKIQRVIQETMSKALR